MEPRAGAAQALTTGPTRLRLAAVSVGLTALAFIQLPGLLTADTKFDLAIDPGRFLERALHLWDGSGAFGQLQNQAYGYLWPMGPFFWAGHEFGIPAWAVQRGWLALVLVVAFLGTALLARALGVRSDLACVLAGVAFALSPRMLTTLGPISIEAWPSALAPWVLLPLVIGSTRGSPRRAAARSALAVAMVGGVNAAATLAVLPLGAWWLLTRKAGPRRRSLMLWWPLFTLLATLWWLLPLFLLGSYSPPFLDYIESSSTTTFSATLFDTWRGTSHWVPYVDPTARAGNDLLRDVAPIVNSGVLLTLGLAGLLVRRNPHRFFLGGGVVIGLVLVSAAHMGVVEGWASAELQRLLDGALAPLRNVHKFDPVVRLPMVIGLAWFVDAAVDRLREATDEADAAEGSRLANAAARVNARVLVGIAVVAVVGAAIPAFAGRIPPTGALTAVPDYWVETAHWLDEEAEGTALLVPGTRFGEYVWGAPHDEPFQSLARSPWAVRNAIPLAPPGNIRMLDEVERRLSRGEGSAGLTAYLARAGVSHLVVRNDLERGTDVPDPLLVHQALADSPGLERVATFGPQVGGRAHLVGSDSRVLINAGWQDEYPAVEVYAVDRPVPDAVAASDLPVVVGGPEDLLDLQDLGVLGDEPTELAVDREDQDPPPGRLILTDGLRATERSYGRIHDGMSQTLGPDDPLRLDKRVRDYLLDREDRWSTTAQVTGAEITASSSRADADTPGGAEPGRMPFAAADGDLGTAWVAGVDTRQAAWWELRMEAARLVPAVTITAGGDDEVVRVRTEHAASDAVRVPAGATRRVELGEEGSTWLRVEDASGRSGHGLSLAEVSVPGVEPRRSLRLASLPTSWGAPDVIVLRPVDDPRTGCVEVDGGVRCRPDLAASAEESTGFDRTVVLPEDHDYEMELMVEARPGDELVQELLSDQPIGVSASSTSNPDPRGSILAAIDGDPGTTWTAALTDLAPEVRLNWLGERTIDGLQLEVDPDTAARLPETLELSWPGGRAEVRLDRAGRATFPPVTTDQLMLRVGDAEPAISLDFSSAGQPVPIGISELSVDGLPFAPVQLSRQERAWPCGSGPDITIGGVTSPTRLTASPAELYAGAEVPAVPCGPSTTRLAVGENSVAVSASPAFVPTTLVLDAASSAPTAETEPVASVTHGPTRTTFSSPDADVLALTANTNPGWVARQGDAELSPVVLDGWRLGWHLDGSRPVRTTFEPDRLYRAGLLFGGVTFLGVAAGCLLWRRRRPGPTPPPLAAGIPSLPLRTILAVGAGGLLAGWPGAGLALVVVAAAAVLSARRAGAALALVTVLVLPAAMAYVLRPWGSDQGWAGALAWPHYLVLAACVLPLGWSSADPSRPARHAMGLPLRRSAGSSMSR